MSRDFNKLKVFTLGDELVVEVYRLTRDFPADERFGLVSQLRRSSVSVPTNIVEGANRASTKEYLHFMSMALGSAAETRYLLGLACRLGFLKEATWSPLEPRFRELVRSLQKLIDAFPESRQAEARSPKPVARGAR